MSATMLVRRAARRGLPWALPALALVGCGGGHEPQLLAASAPAARLVGAWDVRFRLTTPLAGRDTLAVPVVRGTLALVPDRWVREVPQLRGLTHTGSYDVDFRPFGFEPRDVGDVPRAVARVEPPDSVRVVLDPGDAQTPVTLRGAWAGDSVVGVWTLQPTDRAWSGGAGTFVMTPHR